MKFKIGLVQKVTEETTVVVDATDAETAEQMALSAANSGNVEWRFLEATDPIEIVSVSQE